MLRFSVPTMACGGCAKGVVRAIQGVDAAARVEIDTATREVRIESAKADEVSLFEALGKAGYPAERQFEPIG